MPRSRRRWRPLTPALPADGGFALILCILVLTIIVVITVQFQASVRVEERVVQNQASDEAYNLAARGAAYQLMAQFIADDAGEFEVGEYDLTQSDSYAEPYMDEQATTAHTVATSANPGSSGGSLFATSDTGLADPAASLSITYSVQDLERRFNLNWVNAQDEGFRNHAQAALKRLIVFIGHPEEFGDKLIEFLTASGETETTGSSATGFGAAGSGASTGATEDQVPPRQLLSLDVLYDVEDENIEQILTGQDPNGEPVEGVKPLLDFLTVWDTPGINVNTALPEILAAWLPERDQRRPQPQAFNPQRRIQAAKQLVTQRPHLEGDENFEVTAQEDTGTETETEPEPTETETTTDPLTGETTETEGSDFVGDGPLAQLQDFAKPQALRNVFSQQAGQGPNRGGGGGGGGQAGQQSGGPTNWYDVLTFRSRLFRLTITVTEAAEPPKVFEAIIFRGQQSEDQPAVPSVILEWREVEE